MSLSKEQKKKEFQVLLTLHDGKQYKGIIRSILNDGIKLDNQFIKKNDIAVIRVFRQMKALSWATTGFAIGAGIGTAAWFYLISIPDMGSNVSDLVLMSILGGSLLAAPGALLGAASGIDDFYILTGNDANKQWDFFRKRYAGGTQY